MPSKIKVAFASGTDDLNVRLIQQMRAVFPDLPLVVVSEFPPEDAQAVEWVPYHVARSFGENWARCRAALAGRSIRLAGVMLVPNVPYRRMRLMALFMAPLQFLGFNENLNNFMLRPGSALAIARHLLWRARNFARAQIRPGGWLYTFLWRLARPREWRIPLAYATARLAGFLHRHTRRVDVRIAAASPEGISVVIPSRNGRELLEAQLAGILRELSGIASQVIVSDNGSDDGTADWLSREFSQVECVVSAAPLSFARAVNAGIARASYSRVLLLNNDMLLDPGFFAPLQRAFDALPDLFCATAQIRFPLGARREETGKTVFAQPEPDDFPVRCADPLPGEDHTWVLYGSGGCSLLDTAKLRALGCVSEVFDPAYVEDLDLGYRAWQQGWPSVFVSAAVVEHRHRATTSRYYTPDQLDAILEVNYLRFLAGAVADRAQFQTLWRQALRRLLLRSRRAEPAAVQGLMFAARAAWRTGAAPAALPPSGAATENLFTALCNGDVAVFPGRAATGLPRILVASPYLPFPLSHGGAVRMYNLMQRAALEFDQVLVAFCDDLATPPAELLSLCAEIVLVRREGSHSLPSTERPEVVEEFASTTFRAALRESVRKWRPAVAQLEFTQMAQYAADCAPAHTVLVEHDITFDLYQQLLALGEDWETRRQLERWRRFETAAWPTLDRVAVMSEKDRRLAEGARAVCLPNGVDLDRFRPSTTEPEPRRLLFIGSFAHLPNLLALEFFLREVWPRLQGATLHVIAGSRHEFFLRRYRDRVTVDLSDPSIELEGFVADVRPAYERAAVVVAPLVASAGTNIKILEAMAMAKAIVSTPAGVNGLDLAAGIEYALALTGEEMARQIVRLIDDAPARREMESAARACVERDYSWDSIARKQAAMYRELL